MNIAAAWCVLAITGARATFAQQGASLPPVRQLGRRLAVTHDSLGTISGIRQLSDGRLIVNDTKKHQLLLYDSTLSHATVIADSTSSTKKAYGAAPGGIVAYPGDTTLFVDPIALSILVIDPRGAIVRTVAPPRPADAAALNVLPSAPAGVDAIGRVVYPDVRAVCEAGGRCSVHGRAGRDTTASNASTVPNYALRDSIAILRGDIATHVIDTVGFISVPYGFPSNTARNPDGSYTMTQTVQNLLPMYDEWAVVTDGSVAFVRGRDYHVDWVNVDGGRTSTPKITYEWHRLSDSEKTAIIDSVKRRVDSAAATQGRTDSISKANGNPIFHTAYVWPSPSDLADYRPVFFPGAVIADADDNLWIRPRTAVAVAGGPPPTYDIVNRQGRLVDRVQLPPSLRLAGFGPGVVYLTSREGWGTVILKYRIR